MYFPNEIWLRIVAYSGAAAARVLYNVSATMRAQTLRHSETQSVLWLFEADIPTVTLAFPYVPDRHQVELEHLLCLAARGKDSSPCFRIIYSLLQENYRRCQHGNYRPPPTWPFLTLPWIVRHSSFCVELQRLQFIDDPFVGRVMEASYSIGRPPFPDYLLANQNTRNWTEEVTSLVLCLPSAVYPELLVRYGLDYILICLTAARNNGLLRRAQVLEDLALTQLLRRPTDPLRNIPPRSRFVH